jgi:hypothetical protein
MERYEKARIEKKLKQLILTKGFNSLMHIKNINDLLTEFKRDEDLPGFRFENEDKGTMNNFNKFDGTNTSNRASMRSSFYNQQQKNKIISDGSVLSTSMKNMQMFSLNIQLEDGRNETLAFYPNDDPILVAEKFCLKFGLQNDIKSLIQNMIEEKLQEI